MLVVSVKHSLPFCFTNVRSLYNANILSMATLRISISNPDVDELAVRLLKDGIVICVPTDTVYGLACCATNINAIDELYRIKARSESKPIAICVGRVCDIQKWSAIKHLPVGLLESLLPGPVTLILNSTNRLHPLITFNGKIGIRIPNSSFMQLVANKLKSPLALTSANKSGYPSPINVDELQDVWQETLAIFDGGALGNSESNRSGSTVVDIATPGFYNIVRAGVAEKDTENILQQFGLQNVLVEF